MEIKFIELTKGQYSIVDAEDFDWCSRIKWSLGTAGKGYATNKKFKTLHRLLMGAKKGQEVDHINRDSLDNRKENLRICNRGLNVFNHPKRRNNTSGHVGVCFDVSKKKWCAQIRENGRGRNLGAFIKKADAIAARREAEIKVYGFARKD